MHFQFKLNPTCATLDHMNYELIANELVRAIRGDRSQTILSRRLGFRGNQLKRWESGERKIAWDDFVDLCETCNIPLAQAVTQVLSIQDADLDGCRIVRRLIGGAPQTKISQASGISRFAIIRWLSEKSTPSLTDMLKLIQVCQYMLLEFLAYLIDIKQVPSAYEAYCVKTEHKKVFYRYPLATLVWNCLKLDEYRALPKHEPGYIATKVGMTLEEEKNILEALVNAGHIAFDGSKYSALSGQMELTDSEEIQPWIAFWMQRFADTFKNAEQPFLNFSVGLDVYATNAKAMALVKDEYKAFFQKIRSILNNDDGPKEMVCILHSFLYKPSDEPVQNHPNGIAPRRPRTSKANLPQP